MQSQTFIQDLHADHTKPKLVAGWLFFCAFLIFVMALVGAATRLTESGLSITEWKPLIGALPPLTHDDWIGEFARYQGTPEYRLKNFGMSLDEFKHIYYWEWGHRFLGRMIGLAFALPFILFWFLKITPNKLNWALFGLLVLGCAQGFIGWFMVRSGLIDRPSVSHYRLALHLSFALILYSLLIWLSLSVRRLGVRLCFYPHNPATFWLKIHGVLSLLILATTIVWGAFVAGLDAGLIYNEFPTMGGGQLMPKEMWHMTPAWLNFFENHASVQFTHRWLAVSTVLIILSFASHSLLANVRGTVFPVLAAAILLQAGMGIITLISGINIYAAVVHQGGAMIVLGLLVVALHGIFHANPKV